jgi:hypothetical protein
VANLSDPGAADTLVAVAIYRVTKRKISQVTLLR